MDRRDFLKAIGLGGVALTLPKPLSVVTAKIADLADPPLHVGYCLSNPLTPSTTTFMMNTLTVGPYFDRDMEADRYVDYAQRWNVRVASLNGEDRIEIIRGPAAAFPEPVMESTPKAKYPHTMLFPRPFTFRRGDRLEFWILPDKDQPPRFPLPRTRITLKGWALYEGGGTKPWIVWGDVKHMCLERARAIELGLADSTEPFWA